MAIKIFEGKTIEDAKKIATAELKVNSSDLKIINVIEKKGFLGIGKKVTIEVEIEEKNKDVKNIEKPVVNDATKKVGKSEIINIENEAIVNEDEYECVINYLKTLIGHFGVEFDFKITEVADRKININIDTDHNSILIGKNGTTLSAIANVVKNLNCVRKHSGERIDFIIDVGNYKAERAENLRNMAISMAEKVEKTGKSMKLYPMNGYERMLVHSALADNENVDTISVGSDPNRYIIVKPLVK